MTVNATSNELTVTVLSATLNLTATAVSTVYANQPIFITGRLSADNDIPLSGVTVSLQQLEESVWTTIATANTDANGQYQFSTSQAGTGSYNYQVIYEGSQLMEKPVMKVEVEEEEPEVSFTQMEDKEMEDGSKE
jgi:5-hydroxyisourate hydrolase-like protein (transthyretin family)